MRLKNGTNSPIYMGCQKTLSPLGQTPPPPLPWVMEQQPGTPLTLKANPSLYLDDLELERLCWHWCRCLIAPLVSTSAKLSWRSENLTRRLKKGISIKLCTADNSPQPSSSLSNKKVCMRMIHTIGWGGIKASKSMRCKISNYLMYETLIYSGSKNHSNLCIVLKDSIITEW